MPPTRPRRPTAVADLFWVTTGDGSLTVWDARLQETYHSGCGALAESLVVYLGNSGVLDRLRCGQPTRIFEMGFGSGSTFLLTAALARQHRAQLDYWAIDWRLLPSQLVRQLNLTGSLCDVLRQNASLLGPRVSPTDFTPLPELHDVLADAMDGWLQCSRAALDVAFNVPDGEVKRPTLTADIAEGVRLQCILADATAPGALQAMDSLRGGFDAVFFDAFSPQTHPALWMPELFAQMYDLLGSHGSLTSYCVKSLVRRRLSQVGFEVHRQAGPVGGKREVLLAVKPASSAAVASSN